MDYYVNVLNQTLILVMFAVSLNLLMGYAGQISMAHAVLGGVGGYAAAYLSATHGVGYVPGLLIGAAVALIIGSVISFPALRLAGEYLVVMTIALAGGIIAFIYAAPWFGGSRSLGTTAGEHIVPMSFFGTQLSHAWQRLPAIAIPMIIVLLACWRLGESPYGRVLKGMREDAVAVRALGKNTFRFNLTTFAITSAMAGLAGAVLVYDALLASPTQFDFGWNTTIIIAVVIGGLGGPYGPLVGALIIGFFSPVFETFVKLDPILTHQLRLTLYGVVLFTVLRVRPEGLVPEGALLRIRSARRARNSEQLMGGPERVGPSTAQSAVTPVPGLSLSPSATSVAVGWGMADPPMNHAGGGWALEGKGLVKRFGGITAVNGMDFRLKAGGITALVGPNGAGKTTVFNLVTGALPLDQGEVRLWGKDITALAPDRVAALGMVRSFQDVRLIGRMTALQNVLLAVQHQPGERLDSLFLRPGRVRRFEKEARDIALGHLEFVGLTKDAYSRVSDLGYGQQKLVSLARILATAADVLLLDEPASGIDRAWLEPTLEAILRLPEAGKTVMIVEHNLEVVGTLASWVYFLEQGKVTAEGTMEELTRRERLAEVYFGRVGQR